MGILTGFYRHQGRIPRAWPLLHLPADLLRYPPIKLPYILLGVAVASLTGWVVLGRARIASRIRDPIARLAPVILLLGLWAACAYFLFLGFIPAVSFASKRLNLSYWGPLFLLASIICTSLARIAAPRFSGVLAPVIMLLLFYATGNELELRPWEFGGTWEEQAAVFNYLDGMRLDGASRIYAAPNSHLVLSFYSGLPVQNIFPVRKSFLDSYRGDVVYIDSPATDGPDTLSPDRIRLAAWVTGKRCLRQRPSAGPCCSDPGTIVRLWRTPLAPGRPGRWSRRPSSPGELMREKRQTGFFRIPVQRDGAVYTGVRCPELVGLAHRRGIPVCGSAGSWGSGRQLCGKAAVSGAVLLSESGTAVYRSPWRPLLGHANRCGLNLCREPPCSTLRWFATSLPRIQEFASPRHFRRGRFGIVENHLREYAAHASGRGPVRAPVPAGIPQRRAASVREKLRRGTDQQRNRIVDAARSDERLFGAAEPEHLVPGAVPETRGGMLPKFSDAVSSSDIKSRKLRASSAGKAGG